MNLLFSLLFLLQVASQVPCNIDITSRMKPSSTTAAIFLIATFPQTPVTATNHFYLDHPGTSIRFNKTVYVRPNILGGGNKFKQSYPCATIIPIDTDDEIKMHDKIETWMLRECDQVKPQEEENKCFVFSSRSLSYSIPSLSRYVPTNQVKKITSKKYHTPLRTEPPSTPSPTIGVGCTDRITSRDCRLGGGDCIYAGHKFGCRDKTFCGYDSIHACLANSDRCKYYRKTCIPK